MKEKRASLFNYLSFSDFWDLFIALNYILGERKIKINHFRKYLNNYCNGDKGILDEFESKLVMFEKNNIISLKNGVLVINDILPLKELVDNKGYYLENVLQLIHNYQVFDSAMSSIIDVEEDADINKEKEHDKMLRKMEAHYGYWGKTR